MRLTPEDHAKVAEAVEAAERLTGGEICCVVAGEAHDRRYAALAWATGCALVVPPIALLLGFEPQALTRLFGGWRIGGLASSDAQIASALMIYVLIQAAVFLGVWLAASSEALNRLLTPAAVQRRRVHAAALEQFQALGLQRTRGRTGVLLYAALAEHGAEVLVDEGVLAAAPGADWDEVVGLLTAGLRAGRTADGFVDAVRRTGEMLAERLPRAEGDIDELPNAVVEARPRRRPRKPHG